MIRISIYFLAKKEGRCIAFGACDEALRRCADVDQTFPVGMLEDGPLTKSSVSSPRRFG